MLQPGGTDEKHKFQVQTLIGKLAWKFLFEILFGWTEGIQLIGLGTSKLKSTSDLLESNQKPSLDQINL